MGSALLPCLCIGIIIPSVQESGNWPDLRRILNTLTIVLPIYGKDYLIISFFIISYALDFPFFNFLQAFNISFSVIS